MIRLRIAVAKEYHAKMLTIRTALPRIVRETACVLAEN